MARIGRSILAGCPVRWRPFGNSPSFSASYPDSGGCRVDNRAAPGAWLAVNRFRFRRATIALLNALMGLPPVEVGLIVYILFSRSGPFGVFGLLFTPTAMIIAQVIIITPLIASIAHQAIRDLWAEYHDLLISLNATKTSVCAP